MTSYCMLKVKIVIDLFLVQVDELAKLEKVMANDVVVLTHVKIKLKQTVEQNAKLTDEADQLDKQVAKVQ